MTGPVRGSGGGSRGRRSSSATGRQAASRQSGSRQTGRRTRDTGRGRRVSAEQQAAGSSRSGSTSSRRATGRRPQVAARGKGGPSTGAMIGAGAAVILLVVVLIVVAGGGKGGDSGAVADTATESTLPPNPTVKEMDEARALYREAKTMVEKAEALIGEGNQIEGNALKRQAEQKIDQALGMWTAMMDRTPEDKQANYAHYEENEVRHWSLLRRRTFITQQ